MLHDDEISLKNFLYDCAEKHMSNFSSPIRTEQAFHDDAEISFDITWYYSMQRICQSEPVKWNFNDFFSVSL